MKKSGFSSIVIIAVSVFLTVLCIVAFSKEVEVQVHVVQDSGISQNDVTGYVAEANRIDGPAGVTYSITSRHNYGPDTPYDPNKNDKYKINIWAVKNAPNEPNKISETKSGVIWLVADYIRLSTLAHELNHVLDLPDSKDDPNNKMYPDNAAEPNGKVTQTGRRKGTSLTDKQKGDIRENAGFFSWIVSDQNITVESYDVYGDVPPLAVDLDWAQGWVEWVGGDFIVHQTLSGRYNITSFFDLPGGDGAFLINSDGDPLTGEPPEGLDCILTYTPFFHEITLQKYDPIMGWQYVPPEGITVKETYSYHDSDLPPVPSGFTVSAPLNLLLPPSMPPPMFNRTFMFKAIARTNTPFAEDFVPDANMLKLTFPVIPIPGDLNLDNKVDAEDLDLMSSQWQKTGPSRADIFPPPNGDGKVDFLDYATLANNWLMGIP